jgi:hypothetical protein
MPERILALSHSISSLTTSKVREIQKVTGATQILALNAQIEAARAGEHGSGFSIVAREVKAVSRQISDITSQLTEELKSKVDELDKLGKGLIASIRGRRLTDLALNMIEIIDRNLYERSCDVRWWATDSAVVDCVGRPDAMQVDFATKRLAVILKAYTVYLDLWVVGKNGVVLANGRPDLYPAVKGSSVADQRWFQQAMSTGSGDEFVVADIERNALLKDRMVATYAASVRENADTNGAAIGALGIFFDWETQSQAVVDAIRLDPDEKGRTRCLLIDSKHRIIAASDRNGVLSQSFLLETKGGDQGNYSNANGQTVGYALTPGYETYRGLGWYGVIVQAKQTG